MPYDSVSDLPANVRTLSAKKQRQWMHVWNSAYGRCMNGPDHDSGRCESSAFAQANSVVKGKGKASHSASEPRNLDRKARHSMNGKATAVATEAEESATEDQETTFAGPFAYTDPQGGKHLPIHDLPHLRNAIARLGQKKTLKKFLSKEAKQALQRKLQAKLQRAQHAYDQIIAHDLVAFALGPDLENKTIVDVPQDQDVVIRRGMIFRAGEYPDKDFVLSPKELKRVAKQFKESIQIDSEHERSIFDGKLGQLLSVEASKDGTELHGTVAIPKWLDPILKQAGGKVSAAFDRATKKLVGLALTINPRVSDAALMAAFSVDQATHGNLTIKELFKMAEKDDKKLSQKALLNNVSDDDDDDDDDGDDDADDQAKSKSKSAKKVAKAGAKKAKAASDDDDDDDDASMSKSKSNFVGYDGMIARGGKDAQSGGARANMATRSGRGMMQSIHDVTAARGAVCRVEPQPATEIGPYGIVRYASKDEMNVVQAIHDTTLQNGASCTPTLYGQQDVPGGLPWSWQWPGVTDEGYKDTGGNKPPHFGGDKPRSKKGMKTMKAFSKFMQSLDGIDPRYGPQASEGEGRTAKPAEFSDEQRRRDEEVERLRVENRQMRMQGILDRAAAFADKMINAGHATPVEREGIMTVHAQLEHDDTFTTSATFSNGMSRVAAYEASILARPNNLLAAELLPSAVQAGLIKFANMSSTPVKATDGGGKTTEERKRQLTALDPVLKRAYEDVSSARNGRSN